MNIEMVTVTVDYKVGDSGTPDPFPTIEIDRIKNVDFKPIECANPDSGHNLCFALGEGSNYKYEEDSLFQMIESDIAGFLEKEFPKVSFKEGVFTNKRILNHGEWVAGTVKFTFERDPFGVYSSLC